MMNSCMLLLKASEKLFMIPQSTPTRKTGNRQLPMAVTTLMRNELTEKTKCCGGGGIRPRE